MFRGLSSAKPSHGLPQGRFNAHPVDAESKRALQDASQRHASRQLTETTVEEEHEHDEPPPEDELNLELQAAFQALEGAEGYKSLAQSVARRSLCSAGQYYRTKKKWFKVCTSALGKAQRVAGSEAVFNLASCAHTVHPPWPPLHRKRSPATTVQRAPTPPMAATRTATAATPCVQPPLPNLRTKARS